MEKNEKKIWFVNISEYHHRTMGLLSKLKVILEKVNFLDGFNFNIE